ncbi:hypothetical protein FKW77_002115 [Venturia effusa]|uniref:BTB domain-containing protein n=1 Tax=Venturia effusa TaxID=50376 RepID=A0A517L6S1_9PEZI|nr:hypothetical protein FKW77_002115 [Venturia effusa]
MTSPGTATTMAHPPQRVNTYNKTVEVVVGPNEESFLIHETTLTATSKFFRKAMSSPWKAQRGENPIRLADDCPAIFQVYVHWLYTGQIKHPEPCNDDPCQVEPTALINAKTLVLGDVLMDAAFMFAVEQTVIHRTYYMWLDGPAEQYIWETSAPDSRPRRLVLANAMHRHDHELTERIKQSHENHVPGMWAIDMYNEVLFARIGVGRDPVKLAREVMRRDASLSRAHDSLEGAMEWIQRQPKVEENDSENGWLRKRARVDK